MSFIRQLVNFIGVSGLGWLLDFSVFKILESYIHIPLSSCNIISSWVGVTFVFCFASDRIFKGPKRVPVKVKYLIYIVYQAVLIYLVSDLLVYVNSILPTIVVDKSFLEQSAVVAKIAVTPVTMLCNFVVLKSLMEKL